MSCGCVMTKCDTVLFSGHMNTLKLPQKAVLTTEHCEVEVVIVSIPRFFF